MVKGMSKPDAIVVPQRAVLQGQKGKIVYTVEGGDTASPRTVEVGEWIGEDWEVLSGLKAGDVIAVDGAVKLQPGVPVIVADGRGESVSPETKS
jgi:membrane fusion protein (multidrug efflux system)